MLSFNSSIIKPPRTEHKRFSKSVSVSNFTTSFLAVYNYTTPPIFRMLTHVNTHTIHITHTKRVNVFFTVHPLYKLVMCYPLIQAFLILLRLCFAQARY